MPGLDIKQINQLFNDISTHDMDSVPGLSEKGKLVDLNQSSRWHARQVDGSSKVVDSKKAILRFVQEQEEGIQEFNRSVGVSLRDRTVTKSETFDTFASLYGKLNNIIKSEAFSYFRAQEKIMTFLKNPPSRIDEIITSCGEISAAIEDSIKQFPKDQRSMIFSRLVAQIRSQDEYSRLPPVQQKALDQVLNTLPHSTVHSKKPSSGSLKKEVSAEKAKQSPQDNAGTVHARPKNQIHLTQEVVADSGEARQQKPFPAQQKETPAGNPVAKQENPESLKSGKMVQSGKDVHNTPNVPNPQQQANIVKQDGKGASVRKENTEATKPEKAVDLRGVQKKNPAKVRGKGTDIQSADQMPVLSVFQDGFREIHRKAYSSIHTKKESPDTTSAVEQFVKVVDATDYKTAKRKKLDQFIQKHKKILATKLQSSAVPEPEKKYYTQMQGAIDRLETRSAKYLAEQSLASTASLKHTSQSKTVADTGEVKKEKPLPETQKTTGSSIQEKSARVPKPDSKPVQAGQENHGALQPEVVPKSGIVQKKDPLSEEQKKNTAKAERKNTDKKPADQVLAQSIFQDEFKEVRTKAYTLTFINDKNELPDIQHAVDEFVSIVDAADCKTENPGKLKLFIKKHSKALENRLQNDGLSKLQKDFYMKMQEAIDRLAIRLAEYLAERSIASTASLKNTTQSRVAADTGEVRKEKPLPETQKTTGPSNRDQRARVPKPDSKAVPGGQESHGTSRSEVVPKSVDAQKKNPVKVRGKGADIQSANQMPLPSALEDGFKEIHRKAYLLIHTKKESPETTFAVEQFVNAVDATDYKTADRQKLKKFIQDQNRNLAQRLKSSAISNSQKDYYTQMQEAINRLETRSAQYLSEPSVTNSPGIKSTPQSGVEVSQPLKKAAAPQGQKSYSSPARVQDGVAPGLYNWGNTCFFNGYTNYLMLSLSEEEIAALEKMNENTVHLAANGVNEKMHPLALELRDCIVEMWRAYHQTPPPKDIVSLQRKFLSVCTQCGQKRRAGDEDIPLFFKEGFARKNNYLPNIGDAGFHAIRQEDVTELQLAMFEFLLSRLPEQEHVYLQKTKTAQLNGKNLSLFTKSEPQQGGINVRVKDWSGELRKSMHEGLSDLNTEFTSDALEWRASELKECGITGAVSDQRLNSTVQERLAIDSNTQKLTIKIQPFDFEKAAVKFSDEAVDLFEKDGNPLQMELVDRQSGKTFQAEFMPRSIVCHQGSTPKSGHYFTLSFQENNKVMIHNDSQVMELSVYARKLGLPENISVAEFLKNERATPYLIDYRRSAHKEKK